MNSSFICGYAFILLHLLARYVTMLDIVLPSLTIRALVSHVTEAKQTTSGTAPYNQRAPSISNMHLLHHMCVSSAYIQGGTKLEFMCVKRESNAA